jgi:hypothetical protein
MHSGDFFLGVIGGASLALIASCPLQHRIPSKTVADLRLSERRESVLIPRKDRIEIFDTRIAPMYNLKFETPEYKVLERTCIDGVFGSNVDDWKVSLDKVMKTYELCGWSVPAEKTR